MNERRNFLRFASAAVIPAAAVAVAGASARADEGGGGVKQLFGAWDTIHSLPFPPGQFREFLTISEDGLVHETNSFLHTASNLDFSMYQLPNVLNASDGVGRWTRAGRGVIEVVFRKMLFNGARVNFGDLRATGKIKTDGVKIFGDWNVEVLIGNQIVPLGPATSEGARIA